MCGLVLKGFMLLHMFVLLRIGCLTIGVLLLVYYGIMGIEGGGILLLGEAVCLLGGGRGDGWLREEYGR